MQLTIQKRLAATILKTSQKNIWLDNTRLDEIKESITKADIRSLIKDKAIKAAPSQGSSKVRIRKTRLQKLKGRQRGEGSRKGKATSRDPKKRAWINHVRPQRALLAALREKKAIDAKAYRELYSKSKGGFFRSKRHLKLFMEEHGYLTK